MEEYAGVSETERMSVSDEGRPGLTEKYANTAKLRKGKCIIIQAQTFCRVVHHSEGGKRNLAPNIGTPHPLYLYQFG